MNVSSTLADESLSLEDKLKAIADAMQEAQERANQEALMRGEIAAPIDPAELTQCDSCQ